MAVTKKGDKPADDNQYEDEWEPESNNSENGELDPTTAALKEAIRLEQLAREQEEEEAAIQEEEPVEAPAQTFKPNTFNQSTDTVSEKQAEPAKEKPMSNLFSASIQSSVTEDLEKFKENLEGFAKQYSGAAGLTTSVEIIASATAACPVVAITGRLETGATNTFCLLLEKGAKPLPTKTYNDKTESYEVPLTLNHAWNDTLRNIIAEQLAFKGVQKTNIMDYMIVENRLDLASQRNAGIIAITALLRLANEGNNLGAINLAELVKAGKELRNIISIAPGMTDTDILGKEISSDVTSIISAVDKKVNENNDSIPDLNQGEGSTQILKTNAILDALFIEPTLVGEAYSMTRTLACLKPAIIATNIEGLSENSTSIAEDTKSILTSILALVPFAEKDQWKQIVDRHVSGSGKAPVGVIGMYHNCDPSNPTPPGEIKVAETDSRANSKLASPLGVVRDYFEGGMPVLGFDVVEGSRMASAARLLVESAGSDADAEIARGKVVRHIDAMGNGSFSKVWGTKPFIVPMSIVVDGVVQNTDGTTANTSSFDNFQAMSACNGNVEALKSVLVTGGDDNFTPRFIAKRLELINSLAPTTVKAYGTRYYFTREFVEAMDKYLSASNVRVRYDGIAQMFDNRLSGGFDASSFRDSYSAASAGTQSYQPSNSGGFGGFSYK